MKKIIGILLAGALVTSAFAADVSAKVKVDGSLFNFDGKNFSALKVQHNSEGWNPDLSLSINGDRAGASMSFYYGADIVGKNPKCAEPSCWNLGSDNGWCEHSKGTTIGTAVGGATNKFNTVAQSYSVWFKPLDMLKVTAGNYATNMNQETIDWSHTETGVDTQGYAIDLNVDAFFATVFFAPGWENAWFTKNENEDAVLGQIYAKAGYGADFGRIQAMYRLVDMKNAWTGVAYDNTFGSVKMFVNALAGFGPDKAFAIRGEAFASTNIDAFGIAAFVAGGYCAKEGVPGGLSGWRVGQPVADKVSLGATMKLTYNLGVCTPYIYVKEANFLADSFSINVKPGVTGNLGSMAWELAADMNFGETFTINVPVSFTVAF